MAKLLKANGIAGTILRVKLADSSSSTGGLLVGLTSASSSLIISTIADNEAAPTVYTVAASKIESITTLGTFAEPTATKCRFKEVDSTNHKGLYEIQLADARWAVSGAKSLIVTISGAANLVQTDAEAQLSSFNVDNGVNGALTALPAFAADAAGGLPVSDAGGLDMDILSDFTFSVAGIVDVNVTYVDDDLTAAANLKFGWDGATGVVGSPFPSRQDQLDKLANVGAATHKTVESYALSIGTESANGISDTIPIDDITHQHTDDAGSLDLYYQFNLGGNGVPISTLLTGRVNGNNDNLDGVYAQNFETTATGAGTVSVTNGVATIVGAGTAFLTDFDETDIELNTIEIENRVYTITAIADNTNLTLSVVFEGGTDGAASYKIVKWTRVGDLNGQTSGTNFPHSYNLFNQNVGTSGTDLGRVRIRPVAFSGLTSATLHIDQIFIAFSEVLTGLLYDGDSSAIHFSSVGDGSPGTTPNTNGTTNNPVDNVADMNTLLASQNYAKVVVTPGSTMTLEAAQTNQFLTGVNWTLIIASNSLAGSMVHQAAMSGVITGTGTKQMYRDCMLGAITHIKNTSLESCRFSGTQTVGEAGDYFVTQGASSIAGTATWIWDFDSLANVNLSMGGHMNGVQVDNMVDDDVMSLSGQGQLIIDASCTGGTIQQRGDWRVTDNSDGAVTITTDDNTAGIADKTGYTIAGSVSRLDQLADLLETRQTHRYSNGGLLLYVAPNTGNDTTGDGSRDLPYATITKAQTFATAGDGDTIFLIDDGTGPAPTTLSETVSITVDDLRIIGPGAERFVLNRTDVGDTLTVTADRCYFNAFRIDTHTAGSGNAVVIDGGNSNKFDAMSSSICRANAIFIKDGIGNQIVECLLINFGSGGASAGIQVGDGSITGVSLNIIRDNTIVNGTGRGIDFANDALVSDNFVFGNQITANTINGIRVGTLAGNTYINSNVISGNGSTHTDDLLIDNGASTFHTRNNRTDFRVANHYWGDYALRPAAGSLMLEDDGSGNDRWTSSSLTHTGQIVADFDVTGTASGASRLGNIINTLKTVFTGMTSLIHVLSAGFSKQTPNTTALNDINAAGSGAGTFNPADDSSQANRDNHPANFANMAITMTNGYITVGTMIPDVITAASIKADAVTKIQFGLATQANVADITQSQRVRISMFPMIERPDAGSLDYRIYIHVYDETHVAVDLDSDPTTTAENNVGTDRSGNLSAVVRESLGVYYVDYNLDSSDAIEGLTLRVAATKDFTTTEYVASTQVVDTTAVHFTSSDRLLLEDVPSTSEFNARTKPAAEYYDFATDSVIVGTNNDKTGYSISGTITTLDGLNNLSAANVNEQVDIALSDIKLDVLISAAAGDADAVAGSIIGDLTQVNSGVYKFTALALSLAPAGGGGGSGAGADQVTVTILSGGSPVENAQVWITTDANGGILYAGSLITDSNGEALFLLDEGNDYYLWAQKAGFNLDVGTLFTAVAD